MANKVLWENATRVELFPGTVDGAADLKNKLNDDAALSAAVENTEGEQYIMIELHCRLQAGATNGYVNIWLIRSLDGTNFEDGAGGTSPTIPARPPDIVLPVKDTITTAQLIIAPPIVAPPEDFKILLENKTGQSFTNTDNENELYYLLFSDEVQ